MAFSPRWAVGVTLRSSGWKTSGLSHRMWDIDMGGIYEVGWILPQVYLRLALVSSNILRANEAASGHGAGQGFQGIALAASIEVAQQQVLLEVERKNGQIEMRGGYETAGGLNYDSMIANLRFLCKSYKSTRINIIYGHVRLASLVGGW